MSLACARYIQAAVLMAHQPSILPGNQQRRTPPYPRGVQRGCLPPPDGVSTCDSWQWAVRCSHCYTVTRPALRNARAPLPALKLSISQRLHYQNTETLKKVNRHCWYLPPYCTFPLTSHGQGLSESAGSSL